MTEEKRQELNELRKSQYIKDAERLADLLEWQELIKEQSHE